MIRLSRPRRTRLFVLCLLMLTLAGSTAAVPGGALAHTPTAADDPLCDFTDLTHVTCTHTWTTTVAQTVVTSETCRIGKTGRKGTQDVTRESVYDLTFSVLEEFGLSASFSLVLIRETPSTTMSLLSSEITATGPCVP